jgi:hypothetical protein
VGVYVDAYMGLYKFEGLYVWVLWVYTYDYVGLYTYIHIHIWVLYLVEGQHLSGASTGVDQLVEELIHVGVDLAVAHCAQRAPDIVRICVWGYVFVWV